MSGAVAFEAYNSELDTVVEAREKAAKKAEKGASKEKEKEKEKGCKASKASPSKDKDATEKTKDEPSRVPKDPNARQIPFHKSRWDTSRSLQTMQVDLDDLGAAATSTSALAREIEEWKTDGLEPLTIFVCWRQAAGNSSEVLQGCY